MSNTAITALPLQYLDKALAKLDGLGLVPEKTEEAPIISLIQKISDLDEDKAVAIARTLNQSSLFNEVVREQIAAMNIGQRYQDIAQGFNSIREDAKSMVDQLSDGKLSFTERLENVWMKVTRGDIPKRFDEIKTVYLDVARDSKDQIEREQLILDAYRDFRGALKEAEVLSAEVLNKAETELEDAKITLKEAADAIEANTSEDRADIAKLELARDEKLRALQNSDDRYQIAKDLADNLKLSYSTTEAVMTRLVQTTDIKERVYAQSVSFFGTNEIVLTALSASFTGLSGLFESTEALNAMKEGISDSLEVLADVGGKVQEEAIKAGYGPTIRAAAVKKLVDSIVNYQERSVALIEEMRDASTRNADEVQLAVEDGKKRMTQLAAEGSALKSA